MRACLVLLLAFLLCALPAEAQESADPALYKVSDVAADVTAGSAAAARDQAIMQAQRLALEQLMERLGADPAIARSAGDDDVAPLVQAFEVQQERTSAVRYIGTFTVQFKPAAIRHFMSKHGTSYSEVRSKPVAVLPVVNSGKRLVLWEEPTPWRTAWEELVGKGGLVPLIVPHGDLDDIAMISAMEAVNGKPEALQAIASKYQTGGVLVAVLNADLNALDPKKDMRVDVQRYDETGKPGDSEHLSLPAAADAKALAPTLTDAAKQIRKGMDGSWRQSGKAPKGPLAHLPVSVSIASLAEWTAIKAKLTGVTGVSRVNVIALARGTASIELLFYGDIPTLQAALAEQSLVLEQTAADGGWSLRKGNAVSSPPLTEETL